ncbi:MAG: alpha/beta hydrolase [Bacteroidota bacterium]
MENIFSFGPHEIAFTRMGKGDKVIFLHGWPTNSLLWKDQMQWVQHHYEAIAIDWLGFGKSDKPEDHTYTFSSKKEILDEWLNKLLGADEKVTLIAHDIGGPPAIMWTHQNQARVKQLVLLNTVLYPFSTPLDAMSHVYFKLPVFKQLIASPFGQRSLLSSLMRNKFGRNGTQIREIIKRHGKRSTNLTMKTILEPVELGKSWEMTSMADKFSEMEIDRHLIVGKKDPLCYAHMRKMIEQQPDIPLTLLEKSGHYIPLDDPLGLERALKEILLP